MKFISESIRKVKAEREMIKAQLDDVKRMYDKATDDMRDVIQCVIKEKLVDAEGMVTTTDGQRFFFDRVIVSYGEFYALCHPVKKDGTASKNDRHVSLHWLCGEL